MRARARRTLAALPGALPGALWSALRSEAGIRRLERLLRRRSAAASQPAAPDRTAGLIILQIDGLAEPLLQQALADGRMPVLATWLHEGTHRLVQWECGLPSQTSASQAGILYGDNFDIPAFRWYEKESRQLRVSNHPADAALIATRHSNGHGLLSAGGTSISNLLEGDAVRSLLTMSTFASSDTSLPRRTGTFLAFFLNPFTLAHALWLMAWEATEDLYQGQRQRLTNTQPRVARGLRTAIVRSISNALLRELCVYLIRHDLRAGTPIVYCDFVGYDEVAHHAGPYRDDALRVLWGIDRTIGVLERAARDAPRPYHFILLSDHGQSQGATFRQRTGQSLEALLEAAVAGDGQVHAVRDRSEGLGHLSALLSQFLASALQFLRVPPWLLGRGGQRPFVTLSRDRDLPKGALPPVIVCPSGNLALVYFSQHAGRMTLEQIDQHYPGVIEALLRRPEIGFVLVHSAERGPLAIGAHGSHELATDHVEGVDPLAPFGPHAAAALLRLDSYPHVGDLVINSFWDATTQEIAAFEELVGAHGGLGGPQTAPFLLFPAAWDGGATPIVGAEAVHALLQRWLSELGHAAAAVAAGE